jgi:hypothetical protein
MVEHKTYIDGNEVKLVAEYFATKVYVDEDMYYITNYDTVIATLYLPEKITEENRPMIHFDPEFRVKKNND